VTEEGINAMSARRIPPEVSRGELAKTCLRAGDVVIVRVGAPGVAAVVPPDLEGANCASIVLVRGAPSFDSHWLAFAMNSSIGRYQVALVQYGAAQEQFNVSHAVDFLFAVPPLDEQRAIADYLNCETARLDGLVAAKERVLGLVAEKRRALITRAVTRGLDPRAPLRDSGIPWLGKIPTHWKIIQLKFITRSLQTGPFGSQLHAEEYITGGIPVVNPSHLNSGRICADDRVSVDEATAERLMIHQLSPGDVVFARRGELGRCGVVEPSQAGWLCGTGSLRARLRLDMVDPYYLVLVFTETGVADVLRFESVGTTMDNLNTEILGSCQLGVPPLTEQREIVAHIATETDKLDALRSATERTIALLKERRAALIVAAVTGRLHIPEAA
jgi:type I restriction enzyme S subunit